MVRSDDSKIATANKPGKVLQWGTDSLVDQQEADAQQANLRISTRVPSKSKQKASKSARLSAKLHTSGLILRHLKKTANHSVWTPPCIESYSAD